MIVYSNKVRKTFPQRLGFCHILIGISTFLLPLSGYTQDETNDQTEEVIVTGIRQSLQSALEEKRESDNLIEIIQSEDIGKLPDQNLAEVLENVTGIQITREAGVGTGVQIRGTNANRTEINGISAVGSGAGRSGISFDDVAASIISSVEVTKAPQAKTIEGSVGGTINLRTLRPLELTERVGSVRLQGEDSDLSVDDDITPRFSGTVGDNWETDSGDFGIVLSASYTEQDVSSFRPRVDRDNLITANQMNAASARDFHFLPIQFLNQVYENYEYETLNFAGAFEWAPQDNLKLFFDAIINDQERLQESSRVQASGVSSLRAVAMPTAFETVNFGSLRGRDGRINLGSIQAAVRGVIPVNLTADDDDPNLRTSSDTGSRLTVSQIYRLGGEWEDERLFASAEISRSESDTTNPEFSTTLNFINPNVPVDPGGANDNSTPFRYDLTGGSLAFGVAFDEDMAPTVAQLLDPANYVLRDVNQARDVTENTEDAFRLDLSYDMKDIVTPVITSVDAGYRYNKRSSLNNDIRSRVGLRDLEDSPRANRFESLITRGPDNFGDADGRSLFVRDFLLIDPELVNSNPGGALGTLNAAIAANNRITGSDRAPISSPTSTTTAFFDIEEKTDAFYAQANFAQANFLPGVTFRGNLGLRYLDTEVNSVGNSLLEKEDGSVEVNRRVESNSYDFVLPRLNIVAEVIDDFSIRASYSSDIRRPDFNSLSTSVEFDNSPNTPVNIGNPDLEPEEVDSFDVSIEWYFAPTAVVSIGYFYKKRTNLHVGQQDNPPEDASGFRSTDPSCPGGGIFNPIADPNVFAPTGTPLGICVPANTTLNDTGKTRQKGVEFAIQYDLSGWEEQLGWASGFGVLANYTYQDFSGGDIFNAATTRANNVFAAASGVADATVTSREPLLDLSKNAYNITLFYERYGISARMRYTWRNAFSSDDNPGTGGFAWGLRTVQEDRGQLNASIIYEINNFTVGIEGVNITQEDVVQYCVNEGALLCYQGFTDRRITFGASYYF